MSDSKEKGNTSKSESVTAENVPFGGRLKRVRGHLRHSQKEMDQVLCIGKGSWQRYETGLQMPGGHVIASIARQGINANWLLTGEGSMLLEDLAAHQGQTPNKWFEQVGVSAKHYGDEYALVPIYDVRAAAGHGAAVEFEQVTDALMFKRQWINQELHANAADLYLIYVDGESMEPTLRPGDIILIDRRSAQAVPRDGIYVLRIDGSLLVKRLQRLPGRRVTVSSDNPAYAPFELTLDAAGEDIAIVGRVVWSGRRM